MAGLGKKALSLTNKQPIEIRIFCDCGRGRNRPRNPRVPCEEHGHENPSEKEPNGEPGKGPVNEGGPRRGQPTASPAPGGPGPRTATGGPGTGPQEDFETIDPNEQENDLNYQGPLDDESENQSEDENQVHDESEYEECGVESDEDEPAPAKTPSGPQKSDPSNEKPNAAKPKPMKKDFGFFIPKVKPTRVPIPSNLKSLFMPCPIDSCTKLMIPWYCQKCSVAVKYAPENSCFYCDCGVTEPESANFRCNKHANEDESKPKAIPPLPKNVGLFRAKVKPAKVRKPKERAEVLMPCPVESCVKVVLKWFCVTCHHQVEYGPKTGFYYCSCGATGPDDAEFRCEKHEDQVEKEDAPEKPVRKPKDEPKEPVEVEPKPPKKGYFINQNKPIQVPKPIKRRDLLIPCPNETCDREVLAWQCETCSAVLEIGLVNCRFYCDCGESEAKDALFRCERHGFKKPSESKLRDELKNLKPCEEMNILIMGETGVGKSTFINAFANYLTYRTVEEAFSSGKIITLIPNQFVMTDHELNEVAITNGEKTKEENFAPGQSATQETKVHRFDFGETILRIIDTPGIGDVRGTVQDNKNFKNILDTIASLDCLHGIVILLKPNQARLTVTFRYCIQELLVHLHKSAVDNMIFGFTNSRNTNFRPGDTFPALKELLSKQAVDIKLSPKNVYCFDSESYRFLAALKFGMKFDDDLVDSYSKSWQYSVTETERLIAYIRSLKPHVTKQTLSVNNARILILQMAKPLAEITKTIMENVKYVEGQQALIREIDEKNQDLLNNIMIEKIDLVAIDLGHPRTVCTNSACVKITTIDGRNHTNHTQWCHVHCYLDGVTLETTNNPALINCWAMNGTHNCRVCGHNYGEHMHISYELEEKKVQVEDQYKRNQHTENMSFREQKEAKISELEQLQREYQQEYKEVDKAAAVFGAFLKHNAITAYSDARLDYLQHLIDEEKRKPADIRKNDLIDLLENSKATYKEEVLIIEKAIKAGRAEQIKDPATIERTINHLFHLKHFGQTLKMIKMTAVKESSTINNEVSHRYILPNRLSPIRRAINTAKTHLGFS